MEPSPLYETTLVDSDSDLALTITSIPASAIEGPAAHSAPALLRALRLRVVAEVPTRHIADALTALLVTTDVYETEAWLRSAPNPVPLIGPGHPESDIDELLLDRWSDEGWAALPSETLPQLPKKSRAPKHFPKPITKPEALERGVNQFANNAVSDPLVPFQRSPVQLLSMPELLQVGGAVRALLVTARSNPLLLVDAAVGYLLFQAVIGAGQGIRTGMAQGVRYRLLKLLGAPTHEPDAPSEDQGEDP